MSIRSFLCAGLAMMAVGLCAAMPAAAVPIEAHAIVQPMTVKEYPAPAMAVVDQVVAVLRSVMPNVEGEGGGRGSIFASSVSFASTPVQSAAYQHIDPDITADTKAE
jgi:hypothetical protein